MSKRKTASETEKNPPAGASPSPPAAVPNPPLTAAQRKEVARQVEQHPQVLHAYLKEPAVRRREIINAGARTLASSHGAHFNPVDENGKSLATAYAKAEVDDTLERMNARDPVEEMLVQQLLFCQSRIAYLTKKANHQDGLKQLQVVSEALDRAHNTFRRLVQALSDYRNPRPARNFTAIGQFNQAGQQVVQNNAEATQPARPRPEEGKNQNGNATNEKGLPSADGAVAGQGAAAQAVPPVGGGPGGVAGGGGPDAAVANDAGSDDCGR